MCKNSMAKRARRIGANKRLFLCHRSVISQNWLASRKKRENKWLYEAAFLLQIGIQSFTRLLTFILAEMDHHCNLCTLCDVKCEVFVPGLNERCIHWISTTLVIWLSKHHWSSYTPARVVVLVSIWIIMLDIKAVCKSVALLCFTSLSNLETNLRTTDTSIHHTCVLC